MTKNRLEFLSDGVFAIVMTLLVVEINLPSINNLSSAIPELLSYFLSFALLANMWTVHNFFFSLMSQNTTRTLATLNIILLSFISLIPFSTSFLGEYPEKSIAISFYSINILIISLLSYVIRDYIHNSPSIQNPDEKDFKMSTLDKFYGSTRLFISVGTSILAVVISNYSTSIAIFLLLFPVILGIIPGSLAWLLKISHIDRLILK